jgi:peptidoglycan/LPS O-acetylase OafA/YrhL
MKPAASIRFEEIDLLRFLAAMAVVGFHYLYRGPSVGDLPGYAFPQLAGIAQHGYLGVHLFFMISGFVIAFSIQGRSPSQFLVARAARLFPAFWFAVAATTAVVHLADASAYRLPWPQVLANLTMLNHLAGIPAVDGAYWSLYVELGFYLLVWMSLKSGLHRHWNALLAGWLCLAALWQIWPSWRVDQLLTTRYAPFFAAGVVVCAIRLHGASRVRWALYAAAWLLALNAMVGAATVAEVGPDGPRAATALLVCGMFGLMALVAVGGLSRVKGRVVMGLGALTYPLYLLHQVIGFVVLNRMPTAWPQGLRIAIVVLAMLAAAWAVHRWIERPGGRWMRRALERRIGVQAVAGRTVPRAHGGA